MPCRCLAPAGRERSQTMSDRADELVFAAVPYANAAPLAYFLDKVAPNVRVIYDRPAKLAGLLAGGQADVALIPVVDYFAGADLKIDVL